MRVTPTASVAERLSVSVSPKLYSVSGNGASMLTAGAVSSTTTRLACAASDVFPPLSTASTRTTMAPPTAALPSTWKVNCSVTSSAAGAIWRVSVCAVAPDTSRLMAVTPPTSSVARTVTVTVSPRSTAAPGAGFSSSTTGGVSSPVSTTTGTSTGPVPDTNTVTRVSPMLTAVTTPAAFTVATRGLALANAAPADTGSELPSL